MESENRFQNSPLVADKALLRKILEAQDLENGFVRDPTATPQRGRELMIAHGVRPEDNVFTCELLRMREGD
jgi:hypothetical protein